MNRTKKIFIAGFILLNFIGCTSFQGVTSATTNFTSNLTNSIPKNVSEAAQAKIDNEMDIYSIGASNIGDSGLTFANSRAVKDAEQKLREEIKKEAKVLFKTYTLEMDSQSRKIFSPIIPDLVDYTVESQLKTAKIKGVWDDNVKSYVLLVISRESVKGESAKVFKGYVQELGNKIKETKIPTSLNSIEEEKTSPETVEEIIEIN
ncbi:MAG: hypothetical protein ACRCVS_02155 [Fusobacteriaceae bacterium]